jgi:hypothetical protein
MLEGRSVGNRTKVIKKGDDKDSREMVESQAVRDNIINIERNTKRREVERRKRKIF